jgi:hypothetical protein
VPRSLRPPEVPFFDLRRRAGVRPAKGLQNLLLIVLTSNERRLNKA